MANKEQFIELLKKKGYSSLNDFCKKNQIDYGNMHRRLSGERQKIEISFMFKLADLLKVRVETIIEIFYPDEWEENRKYK